MKNEITQSPLEQAHAKATLIGRLFERHGTTLSRAQQFEALAYVEGAANWHMLSAELKAQSARGVLVKAHLAEGQTSAWRIELVHLDDSNGSLRLDKAHNEKLTQATLVELRREMRNIERAVLQPDIQHVAYVDDVLGVLVEQEFESAEADGAETCEETEAACVQRLQTHLLPRLSPVLKAVQGARAAVVTDDQFVWNGRPTCWAFLPLAAVTPDDVNQAIDIVQAFAYPQ